ncbi:hypothetical protein EIZ39_19890 [Ammoniphilus sp. CFH 90114]|nr:hypothetical protein EIZ39_19890 [Ammoniphilus sp. CFH 90114]
MKRRRGFFFIFLILFSTLFYGYHVREFGSDSLISVMALASCISFTLFIILFNLVGQEPKRGPKLHREF